MELGGLLESLINPDLRGLCWSTPAGVYHCAGRRSQGVRIHIHLQTHVSLTYSAHCYNVKSNRYGECTQEGQKIAAICRDLATDPEAEMLAFTTEHLLEIADLAERWHGASVADLPADVRRRLVYFGQVGHEYSYGKSKFDRKRNRAKEPA